MKTRIELLQFIISRNKEWEVLYNRVKEDIEGGLIEALLSDSLTNPFLNTEFLFRLDFPIPILRLISLELFRADWIVSIVRDNNSLIFKVTRGDGK